MPARCASFLPSSRFSLSPLYTSRVLHPSSLLLPRSSFLLSSLSLLFLFPFFSFSNFTIPFLFLYHPFLSLTTYHLFPTVFVPRVSSLNPSTRPSSGFNSLSPALCRAISFRLIAIDHSRNARSGISWVKG